MPVHDWTRVDAGIFHDFHVGWVWLIRTALNDGLLPDGYYALAEQHAGQTVPDVLTLHASPAAAARWSEPPGAGGLAVADAPPRVYRQETVDSSLLARRRTVAIRHVSGHRLVAVLEIVSPANKDRTATAAALAAKAVDALDAGVHFLLVDLFPPGPHDPYGFHGLIRQRLDQSDEPYDLPVDRPLTLASYAAGPHIDIYLEHIAVGDDLPQMPLFLSPGRYINVPLETTYQSACRSMPAFWRDVVEGQQALPQ